MADGMATEGTRLKAVLLDGMGTLLRLVPPAPALASRLGVDLETAERAFRAEVAYYLEHQLEGNDPVALAGLRRRAADVLAQAAGVDPARALEALMDSLVFEAFEDAAPALAELRARGLALVVVSNWDCSLPEVLARVGLRESVDAVVTSAAVGAAKPDPRIFAAALGAAACDAAEAVHVGDSREHDVAGARAAGIDARLLARAGGGDLASLGELPALLS
jgi:putative hydrolase of the HAD superfamily